MDNNYNAICILSWFTLLILSVLIHENARITVREKGKIYLTYILIAAFNGWAYYITADNFYEEGPLYPVYLWVSVAVVLMVAVQIIKYGRKKRRQNQISLFMILTAIALQEVLPWEARTLYIGISITMVLLFVQLTEFSQLAADHPDLLAE